MKQRPQQSGETGRPNDSVAAQLEDLRLQLRKMEGGYRNRLQQALAAIYAQAWILREDLDQWLQFCRDGAWEGVRNRPTAAKQEDAIDFAVTFAVGFDKAAKSRASSYRIALRQFFHDRVPPREISRRLKAAGGVEGARRAGQHKTGRKAGGGEPEQTTEGDEAMGKAVAPAKLPAEVSFRFLFTEDDATALKRGCGGIVSLSVPKFDGKTVRPKIVDWKPLEHRASEVGSTLCYPPNSRRNLNHRDDEQAKRGSQVITAKSGNQEARMEEKSARKSLRLPLLHELPETYLEVLPAVAFISCSWETYRLLPHRIRDAHHRVKGTP